MLANYQIYGKSSLPKTSKSDQRRFEKANLEFKAKVRPEILRIENALRKNAKALGNVNLG